MCAISVTEGHPRLLITKSELQTFRRSSIDFRKPWRKTLLAGIDAHLAKEDVQKNIIRGTPEHTALALSVAWKLTGKQKYADAAEYLFEALEPYASTAHGYDTWGMAAEAAAYLYDWFFDYWQKTGRERTIAEVVLTYGRRALDEFLEHYIVDDWHNYALGNQAGALAAALAVGNDFPRLERGELLRKLHQLHFTGYPYAKTRIQDLYRTEPTVCCLDAALRADGGAGFACLWESTGAYHSVDAFELVKIAQFWTKGLRSRKGRRDLVWPELSRAGEGLIQMMRPDKKRIPLGDARPAFPHYRVYDIFYHLHARNPNPVFAEFLRTWSPPGSGGWPIHAVLCARRDTLPLPKRKEKGRSSSLHTLPLSDLFDPISVLRSGWEEDATMVTFRCGRHGGWHNHLDHNSFTIYRAGALAIDSGGITYGDPHRPEYSMRTIAHNCIVVRNPNEKHWIGRWKNPTVNDGGQRVVFLSYSPPNPVSGGPHAALTQERMQRLRDEFDMGKTVAFHSTEKLDYVAGDATRAYTYPWSGVGDNHSRRVEEAVRQLVFLKPNLVIVFDRVEAIRAEFEKKWLLHTVNAPTRWSGKKKQKAPVGIKQISGKSIFEVENEGGRMTVWPLLPAKQKVRTVGGEGFDCWVDDAPGSGKAKGKNFPPPKRDNEIGMWRLEISPQKPQKRDYFLTVMHAGLKKDKAVRSRFLFDVEQSGEWVTLRILDSKGGEPAFVRFRESGPVAVAAEFEGEKIRHRAGSPKRVPVKRA